MSQLSRPNSPGESRGVGNTRQPPTRKNWCFTLNNYDQSDIEKLLALPVPIVPRFVFQEETGLEGTRHLQGILCFKKRVRPFTLPLSPRIHWEGTRNVKASIAYCQKEETRTGEVYIRGFRPDYTITRDESWWKPWMDPIVDLVNEEPDYRKIHWFWDPIGNIGKTVLCKWLFLNTERCVVLSGKAADMKNCIVNYMTTHDGRPPKTILVSIPRASLTYVSYTGLEEIKDMFFFSGKYEGGMVCGPNPHLIIMANERPDESKMSADRWAVVGLRSVAGYASGWEGGASLAPTS